MTESAPEPTVPRVDAEHEARAVLAIARAFREIPYYKAKGRTPPEAGVTLAEALAGIPLLTKQDIRATLPKQWVPQGRDAKAELASGEIELVETSGSTAERLRILWDKGWWLRQEERGMRVNAEVAAAIDGAHGAYKEAILTTPVCGLGSCHTGDLPFAERVDGRHLFLNMRPDPTYWNPEAMTLMLDELSLHHTVGLESDPMYLATLARHATSVGRTLDVKGFAQLTYAFTTRGHMRAIRKAYSGPLLQLYGASEVGVLFMEGEDQRLHHAPFTTHVELLRCKVPTPGATDVALVVVTTMDRLAQPLVRFVIGDLVQVDWQGPRRFTTVPPLVSIEGRVQDAVQRPDGALITAGAVDRAIHGGDGIDGVALFQLNQHTPDRVEVDIVAEHEVGRPPPVSLAEDVRAKLEPLFTGLALQVRTTMAIAAEPSGKFRVARRHFPLDLAQSFEGCEEAKQ